MYHLFDCVGIIKSVVALGKRRSAITLYATWQPLLEFSKRSEFSSFYILVINRYFTLIQ